MKCQRNCSLAKHHEFVSDSFSFHQEFLAVANGRHSGFCLRSVKQTNSALLGFSL